MDQALTAKDAAEARVRAVIDQCQWEMKVFKFKKYKDRYKDGKRGAALRYPLTLEAFLESQGLEQPAKPDASAVKAGTSLSAPFSSDALPTTGLPLDTSTTGTSTRGASEGADLPTPSSEAS